MAGIADILQFVQGLQAGGRVNVSANALRILEQLQPWALDLARNAAPKWLIGFGADTGCSVPFPNGMPCRDEAISPCIHCGRPSCISHGFIDREGDLICYPCVASFLARGASPAPGAGPGVPPPGPEAYAGEERHWHRPNDDHHERRQQQARQQATEDQAKAARQQQIGWACGVLGVQPHDDAAKIKAAHRKLSAQAHPDKKGGNEQVFKDVQRAFDILMKNRPGG